jgi:hypothetical protein
MPRVIQRRPVRWSAVLSIVVLLAGCATGWQDRGVFYRGARTTLTVESIPAGAGVFLNNRYLGDAPLSAALDCEQEMQRRTRQVSYWVTQPGWSLALDKYPLSRGIAAGALIARYSRRPETRHAAQNETTTLSRRLR